VTTDELERVFAALDHAARRHILQVLHAHGGGMAAGEIAGRFSHSWPTTTRHLATLVDAGLVTTTRHGRERHYWLDREALRRALDLWLAGVGLTAEIRGGSTVRRGATRS
jgi:DNA-binding transcriptional ArsR family regulator